MINIPSVFKKPKYKRFNYRPRFYDPIKEEIDQKIARAQHLRNKNDTDKLDSHQHRHAYLKDGFEKYRRAGAHNGIQKVYSMSLTIVIMVAALFLFLGTGEMLQGKKNEIEWNNYMSYGIIFLCILYFLYRLRNKLQN